MSTGNNPRGMLVLGHPRSGTTLLRRMLGAHPAIAAPPETHLFGACARFLDADMTADGVDLGVLAGLSFAGFEDSQVLAELRKFAFSYLDRYAQRHDKPRWADKTAFDIFHLPNIERLCSDDVYYIGIVRHPLDVAVSCKEFCDAAGTYPRPLHAYIQRHQQPIEAFVRSWVDTTRSLFRLGEERPERCLICRYEDLVEDPDGVLGSILEFIGESPVPGIARDALAGDLTELGFSDHKSYQTDRIHDDSVGRWTSLPRPQIDRLAPLLSDMLEMCGYEPIVAGEPLSTEILRERYLTSLAIHARKRTDT